MAGGEHARRRPPPPPLVGRAVEWRRAQETLARAASGAGQVLYLVGEAGLGKSRLVREAVADLQRRGIAVWETTARPGEVPLAPLTDLVDRFVPGAVGAELLEGLRTGGQSLAHADPAAGKASLFARLAKLLLPERGDPPLALVFEDLHEADAVTREAVAHLGVRARHHPVLLIVAERPSAALWSPLPGIVRLDLEPLEDGAISSLLDEVVDGSTIPAATRSELVRTAGGSPFLLLQIVEGWAEAGHLSSSSDGGRYRFGDTRVAIELPAGIEQAVRQRLLRLEPERMAVVRHAALLRSVARDRLARLSGDACGRDRADVDAQIAALLADGTLATTPDGSRLVFAQEPVRAVAERLVEEAEAVTVHRLAAVAGEEDGGATPDELAHHWLRAGSPERAWPHLVRAADAARTGFDLARAADAYRKAIRLLDGSASGGVAMHPELLERLGDVLLTRGNHDEAESAWRRALELHRRAGNVPGAVRALRRTATILQKTGRYAESVAACDEACALVEDRPAEAASLDALASLTCCYDGRLEEAIRRADRGFARLGPAPPPEAAAVEAALHRARGNVLLALGRPLEAAAEYQRGVPCCERAQDRWERSIALFNTGEAFAEAGFHAVALQWLEQAVVEKTAIGHRWGIAYAHHVIGRVLLARGQANEALEAAASAWEVAAELGDPKLDAMIGAQRGRVLVALGRADEAVTELRRALVTADRVGARAEAVAAATGLSAALRALGDLDGATAAAERARDRAGGQLAAARGEALLETGLSLAAAGDARGAAAALFDALHAITPEHRDLRDRIMGGLEALSGTTGSPRS